MATADLLLLAVTRMHAGICVAGMTTEPDPVTGLRWVRPVREHGHVLLGDITTADGRTLHTFDVVDLSLVRPCPDPPHAEDWIVDFARPRPRLLRRLEGDRRTAFLAAHLDTDPRQVLDLHERSLCLVEPDRLWGRFHLDAYTGKLDAALGFTLGPRRYAGSRARGGLSVTDLKWRALGRSWLPPGGGGLDLDRGDLEARLGIEHIYLVVGLTRNFKGACWPIVVGVHTVPDYHAQIDYDNL
ncbi:MAG: hypothetical protein JXA93_20770 [Anaerolineae bacterium]|nr:hypothetical protein [Anaerolineae bacterium]